MPAFKNIAYRVSRKKGEIFKVLFLKDLLKCLTAFRQEGGSIYLNNRLEFAKKDILIIITGMLSMQEINIS